MTVISTALTGMERAEAKLERTAQRVARISFEEGDAVDLSAEAVALLEARNAYSANLKVAQAAEEMTRKLLDVLG